MMRFLCQTTSVLQNFQQSLHTHTVATKLSKWMFTEKVCYGALKWEIVIKYSVLHYVLVGVCVCVCAQRAIDVF